MHVNVCRDSLNLHSTNGIRRASKKLINTTCRAAGTGLSGQQPPWISLLKRQQKVTPFSLWCSRLLVSPIPKGRRITHASLVPPVSPPRSESSPARSFSFSSRVATVPMRRLGLLAGAALTVARRATSAVETRAEYCMVKKFICIEEEV